MPVLLAVAVAVIAVLVIRQVNYRRQVVRLVRLLEFINTNKTQQQTKVDMNARELVALSEQINELNDRLRETERHHMRQEEALRETIADISHDIRTPLTSLDGYFQLLASGDVSQEKKEYYYGIIRSRLDSLNEMLDELFTYAKLQDPGYSVETAPMDMAAVTADVLLSFYDEIKKTGSEPRVTIPEEEVIIDADKGAYKRIVQNLIKNALLHGRNLSVELKTEDGRAVLTCCDEMLNPEDAVDIDRVFERFYKADRARGTKGSGLGLAISKELTEKMGGRIAASCENGVFAITLSFSRINGAEKNDLFE